MSFFLRLLNDVKFYLKNENINAHNSIEIWEELDSIVYIIIYCNAST